MAQRSETEDMKHYAVFVLDSLGNWKEVDFVRASSRRQAMRSGPVNEARETYGQVKVCIKNDSPTF